ncbi:family S53 protease-like protein [Trametes cingulata]|nr:family S53 protease-like protein [Trametes cingulata]
MRTFSALLSLLPLAIAAANPLATSSATFQVHELRAAAPSEFTEIGPASPETTLSLRLALAQNDANGLVDAVYRVSDPDSPSYGQYLSKDEVEAFVAPQSASVDAVNAWLRENGLNATPLSPAGDWLGIQLPVSKANDMFKANFSIFRHTATGTEAVRTLAYSLPEALQGHVDLVHPTVSFPVPFARSAASAQPENTTTYHKAVRRDLASVCANGTIPACLQELYQIPLTPAVNKENQLGVTGFFGNSAHYAWLETFLETYRPDMDPATNFSVVGIDGGSNDQDAPSVSEGELDIQYTVGLATNVPVTYYFIGVHNQDGDLDGFLDEANVLLALDQPPQVLTTSYAFSESTLSFALTDKLCQAYAQLSARGTTILYASGDSGVGCAPDNRTNFEPTFPSNCPFVTSVGGTQSFSPEEAWTGSSGGFSNYYARPSYQDSAVSSYLSKHGDVNQGRFNASGRAFPDIAAKADNFVIYEAGIFFHIQGTSAASPTVASIIALINDRLASKGRPPLGFLNPWLYKEGYKAFTDINTGNSSVRCSQNDTLRGFEAVDGWDPVTGLGTPRFDKLLDLLNL